LKDHFFADCPRPLQPQSGDRMEPTTCPQRSRRDASRV